MPQATHSPFTSYGAKRHATTAAIAVMVLAMAQIATAQLPPVLSESGPLLIREPLAPDTDIGIYGPALITTDEPAIVSLLIRGNEHTSIEQGFILIGAPDAAIDFTQSPPPAGFYIPNGHSPTDDTQWRQLLLGDPVTLWSLRLVTMTHPHCRLSTGMLLDKVLFIPEQPQPQRDSLLRTANDRNSADYDTLAVAFVTDETQGTQLTPQASKAPAPLHGAHAIRIAFPIEIDSPDVTFSLWVTLQINGDHVTRDLLFSTTPQRMGIQNQEVLSDAPIIETPKENAVITGPLNVSGQAKAGALVVAWLQPPSNALSSLPPQRARRICDRSGKFRITVPIPHQTTPPASYELHIRTEAPGFQSPEATRYLHIGPSE